MITRDRESHKMTEIIDVFTRQQFEQNHASARVKSLTNERRMRHGKKEMA